jgi:hypothetical protein
MWAGFVYDKELVGGDCKDNNESFIEKRETTRFLK